MLGKRKRETTVIRRRYATYAADSEAGGSDLEKSNVGNSSSSNNSHDIFRKHFEDSFGPLKVTTKFENSLLEEDIDNDYNDEVEEAERDGEKSVEGHYKKNNHSNDDQEDFTGFSDDEARATATTSPPVVEIIEASSYTPGEAQEVGEEMDRIFRKKFLNSRPPRNENADLSFESKSSTIKSGRTGKSKGTNDGGDEDDDSSNLKNDLDLQRLLRESHLLSQSRAHVGLSSDTVTTTAMATTTTTLHGKQRHQATDLRFSELGSKSSSFMQVKMPMSHRKGIQLKNKTMEARRQREARENGIILENSKKGGKGRQKTGTKSSVRRDRGVDIPVLGKFRGGTLSLSKKDVASIQGPARRSGGGGGKRRGRR